MKVKTFTLMLCALFVVNLSAQKPTALINEATVAPVLDGDIDEVWAEATAIIVDKPFQTEVPTLGEAGETYWKGLWTDSGIYVLVNVTDDNFYPHYMNSANNEWEMDKVEIYFDVNLILTDNVGAMSGNGHYQVAPGIDEATNDGTPITWDNGVVFSHKVTDPNYVGEFFVPFTLLVDKDGIGVDVTGEIGFDVCVVDRDPGDTGRRRLVWANDGPTDSWGNMDNCGIITLDGAEPGIFLDYFDLVAEDITENNGTVKVQATNFDPVDATNTAIRYSIENGTGRATITNAGIVTAIADGDVTITGIGADGGGSETSIVLNITNQIVSLKEVNVIRNPNFDLVEDNGQATHWGGWSEHGDPMPIVVDGAAAMTPTLKPDGAPEQWHYQYNQVNFTALPDVDYEFSFVAWAEADAVLPVDFEDIQSNGGSGGAEYNRYGITTDSRSADGRSEWKVPITTMATRYVLDVNFDEMKDNTVQKVQFMPGLLEMTVYLDSVILISLTDKALIDDYIPVESIEVSGADVAVGATSQMSAAILPAEADYPTVKWSVVAGTGTASIDANGLLTGDAAGTVTVVALAVDDSWISDSLEVTVTTNVGIAQNSLNTLKVYPNPAVNQLNVVLTSDNERVSIYNSVGQKMEEVTVNGTQHQFDISSYAAGIYFVKSGTMVTKFIK